MSGLVDQHGRPIQTFKKAKPPKMGPAYGDWAGRKIYNMTGPGGSILQFDLSGLTLADYRVMKTHPQVNASLAVLNFMIHQIDWHIECKDKKIEDMLSANMDDIWTRLVRAFAQAFWAGYSPCVLEFENGKQYIEVSKVKDLYPEDCCVHWKEVEGYAPPGKLRPKYKVFDGMEQAGSNYPIPPEQSLWYPLMLQNGDYYGKKLLKSAFVPWYFSTLIHLYANRYYERFGEPVPVGRYPDETETDMGGVTMSSKAAMDAILTNIRNRSVVSLPSDRDPVTKEYDWGIEYLESDMRGIDFERYMNRLDEEISLAIFTPILMFRTGDVGSNNLGVQHTQTFMWLLNAIIGDMREYIERYVLFRLRDFNFGPNGERPYFRWKKLGIENTEAVRAIISALISKDKATVDLDELGTFLGMSVKEVKQLNPANDPNALPGAVPGQGPLSDPREVRDKPSEKPRGVGEPRATGRLIAARVGAQVRKAWSAGRMDDMAIDYGYRRRMIESFMAEGLTAEEAQVRTSRVYDRVDMAMEDLISIHGEFQSPSDFCSLFERHLDNAIDAA